MPQIADLKMGALAVMIAIGFIFADLEENRAGLAYPPVAVVTVAQIIALSD